MPSFAFPIGPVYHFLSMAIGRAPFVVTPDVLLAQGGHILDAYPAAMRQDLKDTVLAADVTAFNTRLELVRGVVADVLDERDRQMTKWGDQTHSPEMWHAILSEEVGEAAEALLHDAFGGAHAGTLEKEMIEVAAVALAMVEALREGRCGTRYTRPAEGK